MTFFAFFVEVGTGPGAAETLSNRLSNCFFIALLKFMSRTSAYETFFHRCW